MQRNIKTKERCAAQGAAGLCLRVWHEPAERRRHGTRQQRGQARPHRGILLNILLATL